MKPLSAALFAAASTVVGPLAGATLAQVKAFPQAEGFGAAATGGRGGDVYHVTKLTDDGSAGTLRHALSTVPASGRTVVFDVGGWITLTSKLGLTNSRVTIAGHTAPGGIGIRNGQFSVGGDDVVVRHMRFRPGKITNTDHDSVNTNENAQRVIYDHISADYSTDGGFDLQADEVTLQHSSVSFGLLTHSTGGLIQSPTGGAAGQLTFHHNMFAHNETRNPKARSELIDWRDNVIYNYHNGFLAGESDTDVTPNWRANFDGNTYISNVGGNSGSGGRPMMTGGRTQNYDLWYGVNALDRDSDSADDPIVYTQAQAQASQQVVSSAYNWSATAFDVGVNATVWQSGSPAAAYARVLAEFGATPWARDAVNQLIHDQVLSRTGQRISNENLLGLPNAGYPTLGGVAAPADSDADGMPDVWELKHGTNPAVASNNSDFDSDGYTDLEEYLNDVGAFPAPGPLVFDGSGRYADWANWTNRWEPSRADQVRVISGTAIVDAVGQRAGTLIIAATSPEAAAPTLVIQNGWLEASEQLRVGESGSGHVVHSGGTIIAPRLVVGTTTGPLSTYTVSAGTLAVSTVDLVGGGKLTVAAAANRLLQIDSLTIDTANASTLDLNDNDAIVSSVDVATIAGLVASARNGGAWNGAGMTSTTARFHPDHSTTLAVLSGSDYLAVNGLVFHGATVAPTDTLVKYTWYGDTDFNGSVDFDDYVRTDGGFNGVASGWSNGDFDFNGVVDFDDYVLIDLAFNSQNGTLRRAVEFLDATDRSRADMIAPGLVRVLEHFDRFGTGYAVGFLAAVPEPTFGGLMLALTVGALCRRTRRGDGVA